MRILLADDHVLFRSGMRYILADLGQDVTIDEVGTAPDVLTAIQSQVYDLVLMDMLMPGMNQTEVISKIKELCPLLPIVIISMLDSPSIVRATVGAGASGYIPKTSTSEVMTEAVRLVLAGGVYLPPSLLDSSDDDFIDDSPSDPAPTCEAHLTRQQRAVLAELSFGKSNKEIAHSLSISEATVKVHLAAIMRTLKVRNRTQVVLVARRLNLLA